ncbi:hypothetical protein OXIME_000848 [Oxyplasma meridianum]|uniref:LAGLIDADG endonuclease n=1 Tax=Oxyplasma meridianum TaxID=3073602 RepID=A0AAX4NG21_9ARCH
MTELTLSNNVLPLCAIIKIENVFPKNIRVSDRKHEPNTMFMMLAMSQENLNLYMSIISHLSEAETNKFVDFWKITHFGRKININRNIVEMEVPVIVENLVNKVNKIPLARVAPNILRRGSDMYLSLEFCNYSSTEMSRVIFEMLDDDPSNINTLEYFGDSPRDVPFLLHKYFDLGFPIRDFMSITTVMEPNPESVSSDYSGFFLNQGKFVPKLLSGKSNDVFIIKLGSNEIRGDLKILCHDHESGLAEVEIKSGFLSDLLNEIIKGPSGSLFYGGENLNGKSMRYYVINTDLMPVFLKELSRFWKMPGRKALRKYLYKIEKLESKIKMK